ncbi:TonB family protein [Sandarakinorhabdus sp. DWP1-3-1]|uniref:energy transducer TonB n=1 Tax=Sandarakinorhabdus sp. DWP1-3-1 TaxID=2804627 RepID=UPI003CF92A21
MSHGTYLDSCRHPAGLAVTIALHAGLAAIGLFAVSTTLAPTPLPPMIITDHPDPVHAPPIPTPPDARDIVVQPTLAAPIFTVEVTPPDTVRRDSPIDEPVMLDGSNGNAAGDIANARPVTPAGPTVIARLDTRSSAQPPYPAAARRMGEEGSVIVHVRIGRDGRVLAASLGRSSGSPRLDAAAVAHALAHWRFSPALDAGVAVAAERDITVRFRLDEASA